VIYGLSREQSRVKAAMRLKFKTLLHVDVNFESVAREAKVEVGSLLKLGFSTE
jgi:hypothetical protein